MASITCPVCGMTSHNPNDVTEGYCGNCHDWTRESPEMAAALRDIYDARLHLSRAEQRARATRWMPR